jgi:hypothetical protein
MALIGYSGARDKLIREILKWRISCHTPFKFGQMDDLV